MDKISFPHNPEQSGSRKNHILSFPGVSRSFSSAIKTSLTNRTSHIETVFSDFSVIFAVKLSQIQNWRGFYGINSTITDYSKLHLIERKQFIEFFFPILKCILKILFSFATILSSKMLFTVRCIFKILF